jgi:hypothetical protein
LLHSHVPGRVDGGREAPCPRPLKCWRMFARAMFKLGSWSGFGVWVCGGLSLEHCVRWLGSQGARMVRPRSAASGHHVHERDGHTPMCHQRQKFGASCVAQVWCKFGFWARAGASLVFGPGRFRFQSWAFIFRVPSLQVPFTGFDINVGRSRDTHP